MPIAYLVDRARNIITETWSGTVSADDLGSHWRGYLADPEVMSCRRTLVDLRGATLAFSGSELSTLVKTIVLPALQGRKWVTAILAAGPTQYGTSRQYHVFAESYSTDSIFSDSREAEEWLLRQQHDDST